MDKIFNTSKEMLDWLRGTFLEDTIKDRRDSNGNGIYTYIVKSIEHNNVHYYRIDVLDNKIQKCPGKEYFCFTEVRPSKSIAVNWFDVIDDTERAERRVIADNLNNNALRNLAAKHSGRVDTDNDE